MPTHVPTKLRKDATLKLRVPTTDLEMWRGKAHVAQMSLSEWIRSKCNEIPVITSSILKIPDSPETRHAVPTKSVAAKTCYCWQCQG